MILQKRTIKSWEFGLWPSRICIATLRRPSWRSRIVVMPAIYEELCSPDAQCQQQTLPSECRRLPGRKKKTVIWYSSTMAKDKDLTSPNLVWKLLPNTVFSKLPTAHGDNRAQVSHNCYSIHFKGFKSKKPAVMRKTKSRDPVNPVAMVISWEEARMPLYT